MGFNSLSEFQLAHICAHRKGLRPSAASKAVPAGGVRPVPAGGSRELALAFAENAGPESGLRGVKETPPIRQTYAWCANGSWMIGVKAAE